MSTSENLQSFLIRKTSQWTDCKKESICLGGIKSYIKFNHSPSGISNPLSINFFSNNELKTISFNLKQNLTNQFIKPVGVTPYYFSYLTSGDADLKILDFFSWNPVYTFYRVFFFNFLPDQSKNIETSVGPTYLKINLSNKESMHFYSIGFQGSVDGKDIRVIPAAERYHIRIAILSGSTIRKSSLNQEHIFDQIKKLTTLCEQHNFSQLVSTQSIPDQHHLFSLWRKQRAIRPDLSIDHELLDQCEKNAAELTWTGMVAVYFDLQGALRQLIKALESAKNISQLMFLYAYIRIYFEPDHRIKIGEKGDNTYAKIVTILSGDKFDKEIKPDEFPYFAYFTNAISEDRIYKELQSWWNYNSLPVFESKLNSELNENPERLFIIALLAIKHRLPWADIFINHCNEFNKWPLLSLLINSNKLLTKTPEPNSKCLYSPGISRWGNKKSLHNKNSHITWSAFGKKKYVTVHSKTEKVLKFDQSCRISVSSDYNEYRIYAPFVLTYPVSVPMIKLRVEKQCVNVPLIWRKAELNFCGIRLRWILKKDRVQMTFQNRLSQSRCELNNEPLEFGSQTRIVKYQQLTKREPIVQLFCLDRFGRDLHFNVRSKNKDVLLCGYVMNRYGMLAEKFNCIFSGHQTIIQVDSDGYVNSCLSIPQHIAEVTVRIKGYSAHLNILNYKKYAYEAWLRYGSVTRQGEFLVVLSDEIAHRLAEIREYFTGLFHFEPIYLIRSKVSGKLECSVLLSVGAGQQRFSEIRDPKLTSHPFIQCGIEFLFMQSSENQLLSELLDS